MKKILFILSALFVVACSTDDSSSATPIEPEKEELSFWDTLDTNSYTDYEFFYNYENLRILYLNAKEELKGPEEYYSLKSKLDTEFGNTYEMYETLSSSYTNYIPPEYAMYYFSQIFLPKIEMGIGIEIDENLIVSQVYANSPAHEAGLLRGDSIVAVNGNPIFNVSAFEKLASGEEGEIVELEFMRGDGVFIVEIELKEFVMPTVFVDSIDNVPVIKITSFEFELTDVEFEKALEETKDAKATIIDLRDNRGGEFDACISMAAMLLNKGDTIIRMEETDYDEIQDDQIVVHETMMADKKGLGADRYYVFLANANTASCSETFLSGVSSNKKSPIIGLKTYGKGIGTWSEVTPNAGIYSIYAIHVYDKFGESFHARGFEPDYKTSDEEEMFDKALEFIEVKQQREAGYGKYDNSAFLKKESAKTREKPGMYKWRNPEALAKFKRR